MKVKSFTMTAVVLTLAISGTVYAKQDKTTDQEQHRGSESSEINTNRQFQTEEDVRGQDRAEERHELKESKSAGKSKSKTKTKKSKTRHAKQK